MAGRLNTDWFVVYVETPQEAPDRIDSEAQRHLLANIEKARELGAEVVRLQATDPVAALLDFARSHGVGHIIIGRSHQPWWRRLLGRAADAPAGARGARASTSTSCRFEPTRSARMTLRTKLLLAQAPLALALVVVGVVAVVTHARARAHARSASSRTTTAACSPRSG